MNDDFETTHHFLGSADLFIIKHIPLMPLSTETLTTHDCVGAVYYEGDAVTTGVLVDDSWVLTVAHALDYGTASYFIIGDDYNSPETTFYSIDQIIVHPDFDMPGGIPVNNFALLHLATPVTGVDILPLMSSPTLSAGTSVLSIGYGATSNTGVTIPGGVI